MDMTWMRYAQVRATGRCTRCWSSSRRQVGGNLMGSDHTYIIPGPAAAPRCPPRKKCAPGSPCLTHVPGYGSS